MLQTKSFSLLYTKEELDTIIRYMKNYPLHQDVEMLVIKRADHNEDTGENYFLVTYTLREDFTVNYILQIVSDFTHKAAQYAAIENIIND